jgi:hypothetical protein
MDGHVAFLESDAHQGRFAIRCWHWNHGFEGDRTVDAAHVVTAAEVAAAAQGIADYDAIENLLCL